MFVAHWHKLTAKRWPGNTVYWLLWAILFSAITIAHLFQLDRIPTGFFQDETAIGYNAALIAQTGRDEYGVRFPTYFKSFDDYKAPIYIYAVAAVFKLFGIGEFNLRFVSFVFYLIALIAALLLISKLFPSNKLVQVYALASYGFLPHFFTLSRISFDAISQVAFIAVSVLLVWNIFCQPGKQRAVLVQASLCGLCLGISTYAYQTARLLTPLTLLLLWIVFSKRAHIQRLVVVTLAYCLALIPLGIFAINNPAALTARLNRMTYIYESIAVLDKIGIFLRNYLAYWSPDFLIRYGDTNLRHATGYGGVIYSVTWLLFLVSMALIVTNKKLFSNRFIVFLALNLLATPTAAAVASASSPHAIRGILLSYYLVICSCYGFDALANVVVNGRRHLLTACLCFALMVEVIGYQYHYFTLYPVISAEAMEGFDFKGALRLAIAAHPREISFVNQPSAMFAHVNFYAYIIANPNHIPIRAAEEPDPQPGSCLIYDQRLEKTVPTTTYPYTEYESPDQLALRRKFPQAGAMLSLMKVRCYEDVP